MSRKFKDRVKGLAWIPGKRIDAAPKNFRTHDSKQRAVLSGALDDIGIAGAVMVWVPDDEARASLSAVGTGDVAGFVRWFESYRGRFQLYDGHLRKEEIRDQPLPAIVTDLSAVEASEALATFDAVGDLAGFDTSLFVDLLGDFSSTNAAVQELCADLALADKSIRDAMERESEDGDEPIEDDDAGCDKCPQCGQRLG